jgi:uncharacterized membrane protein YraQ (UPF0718 family)/copper chaperone CopZ
MIHTIYGFLNATWNLLYEMAPFLLLGFLIAGILNLLIPRKNIHKHLSGNGIKPVVKATLFGIPLPVCSCGVIPIAAYLRKEGAGKGPTISFLASTPTTGVDSMLVTYSLLGPLFAIARPLAALFAGIFSGTLVTLSNKNNKEHYAPSDKFDCNFCDDVVPHKHAIYDKIKAVLKYGFVDLIADIGKWLIFGIVLGGAISYLIPGAIIEQYLGNPSIAYPIMLLISVPMYICTIGSIPIAASLIMGGMSPGAGLVFLIAGPATNVAELSFIIGKLGKKTMIIYLFSIIFTAVIFGFALDTVWHAMGGDIALFVPHEKMIPGWINAASAIIFITLILNVYKGKILKMTKKDKPIEIKKESPTDKIYRIPDMTCNHCVSSITKALKNTNGINVDQCEISVDSKKIKVKGDFDEKELIENIEKCGYTVEKIE